jgi:hypothetical protein
MQRLGAAFHLQGRQESFSTGKASVCFLWSTVVPLLAPGRATDLKYLERIHGKRYGGWLPGNVDQ